MEAGDASETQGDGPAEQVGDELPDHDASDHQVDALQAPSPVTLDQDVATEEEGEAPELGAEEPKVAGRPKDEYDLDDVGDELDVVALIGEGEGGYDYDGQPVDEDGEPLSGTLDATTSVALKRRRRTRGAAIIVVLALLAVAGEEWYLRARAASTQSVRPPASPASDKALAARIGIQSADLAGWSSVTDNPGNAFAGQANASPAAQHAAQQAGAVLARCLHLPTSDVNGAFGIGPSAANSSATAASPVYSDPKGGGIASSVVDVTRSASIQQADARIFQDPQLFSTCYEPFVQAMLPYGGTAGTGTTPGTSFATDTVQPAALSTLPSGSGVTVAAFYIARIGSANGQTVTAVTTAIAIYGGRLQATVSTVSGFVFPPDVQNALVHAVEVRVLGAKTL